MLEYFRDEGNAGNTRNVANAWRLVVTPRGILNHHAAPSYTLVGNRGVLHDMDGTFIMPYASTAWLACTPLRNANEPRRPRAEARRYTLLFFLDGATALAAGHRPCWTCRRLDFWRFRTAWANGNGRHRSESSGPISKIDAVLHSQRITPSGEKVTFSTVVDSLPDGCMVRVADFDYLVFGDHLYRWSPGGYTEKVARPVGCDICVLTPRSIVAALSAGYRAHIHSSVGSL